MNGIDPIAIQAVLEVESRNQAFLDDGRPVILFERHVFRRLTKGVHDEAAPKLSAKTSGEYGAAGAWQWKRLEAAKALDEDAALQSTSWGLPQIMGFNYSVCGFADVKQFVFKMSESRKAQLEVMETFLENTGIGKLLNSKDWEQFALRYNGPNALKNGYHTKLKVAYERLAKIKSPVYQPLLVTTVDSQEADMTNTSTEVFTEGLPSKPALESNSMWASIITMLLGMATLIGLPDNIATWIGANKETMTGIILQMVALYSAWATLRRKTTVKL